MLPATVGLHMPRFKPCKAVRWLVCPRNGNCRVLAAWALLGAKMHIQ
jgi:hypothetical protein